MKSSKICYLILNLFIYLLLTKYFCSKIRIKRKRIGVINLPNGQNVGNILVKYAMFKKLEELGFNSTIITPRLNNPRKKVDLGFINRTINKHLLIIKENFSELNENDYDYLVLNSDQTWVNFNKKYFFDVAFFKFAENWKIKKFIYATSIGRDNWPFKTEEEKIAKKLIKNFSGLSFREKGLVKLVEEHLGLKGLFVLDPTLLIDKQYYINEIKDYRSNLHKKEKISFYLSIK